MVHIPRRNWILHSSSFSHKFSSTCPYAPQNCSLMICNVCFYICYICKICYILYLLLSVLVQHNDELDQWPFKHDHSVSISYTCNLFFIFSPSSSSSFFLFTLINDRFLYPGYLHIHWPQFWLEVQIKTKPLLNMVPHWFHCGRYTSYTKQFDISAQFHLPGSRSVCGPWWSHCQCWSSASSWNHRWHSTGIYSHPHSWCGLWIQQTSIQQNVSKRCWPDE